jgi:hypothetical protein
MMFAGILNLLVKLPALKSSENLKSPALGWGFNLCFDIIDQTTVPLHKNATGFFVFPILTQ